MVPGGLVDASPENRIVSCKVGSTQMEPLASGVVANAVPPSLMMNRTAESG